METLIDLLLILGGDFLGAIQKVLGVAVVGVLVLFVAERTLIRRHIASEIVPLWSMLMAYFLTLRARLDEIERASSQTFSSLGVRLPADDAEAGFSAETWRDAAPGSARHELKRALMDDPLTSAQKRDAFAPLTSSLLKLKNDADLLRSYSDHLFATIMSLWSEKLHLFNAVGGGVESLYAVSKEAEALDFYVTRHLDILLLYLDSYNAGDHDEVVCENIANYWPYFLGQRDRMLATAREEFLHEHLGEKERRTLTLRGRVAFIGDMLTEAREEIGRKIGGTVPEVEVGTIWGR